MIYNLIGTLRTTVSKKTGEGHSMKNKLPICFASLAAALCFSFPVFAGELIISTSPVTTAESGAVGVKFYVRSTYANSVNARASITSSKASLYGYPPG